MVELASKYSTYRLSQVHSGLTPNRLPGIGKKAKFQSLSPCRREVWREVMQRSSVA